MSSESKRSKEVSLESYFVSDLRSSIFLVVSVLFVGVIFLVVLYMPKILIYCSSWDESIDADKINRKISLLGTYGDSFGVATALFTGLGLIGLVYNSILGKRQLFILQSQRAMQEFEIEELKKEREEARCVLNVTPSRNGILPIDPTPGIERGKKYDSVFVKMKVENKGPATAKGCRAYLIAIAKWTDANQQSENLLLDPVRLRWAYEPEEVEEHKGIDIPKGIPFHFDVFSTKLQDTAKLRIIQASSKYLRYDKLINILDLDSRYEFLVHVVAENAELVPCFIRVELGADINQVTVYDIESFPDPA